MSGLAACGACVFTNPLEVVKTRMQLQGELRAPGTYQRHYRNVFHAFFTIGKVDGLAALQKGLAPALLYQFLMNGIRLGTYGLAESRGYMHTDEGTHSPYRSAAAGAMAGVMGAYLGSPIYMVRRGVLSRALRKDPLCRVEAQPSQGPWCQDADPVSRKGRRKVSGKLQGFLVCLTHTHPADSSVLLGITACFWRL